MRKIISAGYNCICFLILTAVINHLSFQTPPPKGSSAFLAYQLYAIGCGVLLSSAIMVYFTYARYLEKQLKEMRKDAQQLKKMIKEKEEALKEIS